MKMNEHATTLSSDVDGVVTYCLRHLLAEGSALQALWQEGQLCDVVLESNNGYTVRCHKIVLASVSPFFRAMFTGAGREMAENEQKLPTGESVVVLHGINREALQIITKALYENTIKITSQNLETVLGAANLLEIAAIRDVCCQYLRSMLCVENCLMVLIVAETYNCLQLRDDTMKYVCERFSEVLSVPQWKQIVGKLTKLTVLEIIQSQDITVESERQILSFGLAWIRADAMHRRKDGHEIVSRVQLSQKAIREEIFAAGMRPNDLIPVTQFGADRLQSESKSLSGTSSRTPTHILVAGGHDTSWRTFKTVELYDPVQDIWIQAPSMPSSFSIAGAAAVSRGVVVVGGSLYDGNVCHFDKRLMTWSQCPALNTSRIHSAVAGVGSTVYVCGGRTGITGALKSTELYRPLDPQPIWTEGPLMCEARCAFGMASLWGDLYAVGGQSAREIYSTAEFLPRGDSTWRLLASSCLKTPRKYLSVAASLGRIFAIAGMNEQRHRLSTVEALDPREGKWHEIASLHRARSSCYATTFKGTIYVIGGNAGDDVILDSMEKYVHEADAWIRCAQLASGRSGLSAVAV